MISSVNSQIGADVFVAANAYRMHIYGLHFLSSSLRIYNIKDSVLWARVIQRLRSLHSSFKLVPNRDLYAFWDPFHPSERANRFTVQQIMTGNTKYMHPLNLSTIMALDTFT